MSIASGSAHWNWKGGNPRCALCKEEIDRRNKSGICRKCINTSAKVWRRYNGVKIHIYTWIFLTEYGPPPHLCYWCAEPITDIPLIHHIDEDKTNNELENLAPMHHDCHTALHHWLGRRPDTNKKISASLKKYWSNPRAGFKK